MKKKHEKVVNMLLGEIDLLRDEKKELKAEIKRKDEALKEAEEMAEAIEKCCLEHDKIYIYAVRIERAVKQALSEVKE